jgi:hypothetical protein
MRLIFLVAAFLIVAGPAYAQRSEVNMSVLPSGRSGAPNTPITFFATIANTGDEAVTCTPRFGGFISLPGLTAEAKYFEMDGGAVIGGANAAAVVPAGGSTPFLVELTVSGAYVGEARSIIDCVDESAISTTIPQLPLVNSYYLDIAPGAAPDIIMIGQTLSGVGVARVGETGPRALLMTVAAINNGDAGTNIVVDPGLTLFWPLDEAIDPTVCETDAVGICLAPESDSLTIADWPADETRFFAVRARLPAQIGAPFFPDVLRLELKAGEDADNLINGTSVATDGRRRDGTPDPASAQFCHMRLDGDVSVEWSREGVIVFEDDGAGGEIGRGVTRVSELQLTRTEDQLVGFDTRRTAGGETNGEMSLQGRAGGPQALDVSFPVSLRTLPSGGYVIQWDGEPGVLDDFRQSGRMRCAPAPRPEGEAPDQTGSYAVVPDDPDTSVLITEEEIGRTIDLTNLDLRITPEPDEIVADAFWFFLSCSSVGRPPSEFPRARLASGNTADFESRGGVLPLTWDDTPDGRIMTCAIVFFSGMADTDGADDAVAELIVRDGYTPETAGTRCAF